MSDTQTVTSFDPVKFKESTRQQWNAVSESWDAWGDFLQRWLGPATDALLDMAKVGPGGRILHVATGSGQEVVQSSQRVGSEGYVLATDFSESLVALAQKNIRAWGLQNTEAEVMDGEALDVPPDTFDLVVSRVGLIFFPDQMKSVKRMKAALKPGGYVGAIVYSTPEENRFFSEPVGIIRRHAKLPPPAPGQPGPFSLGAPGKIETLFDSAGLVNVEVRKMAAPLHMDSASECLRFEQESFGALHQMLSGLDDAGRRAAWNEVGDALRAFETGDGFQGPCSLLVAVGQKPGRTL